MIIAHCMFLSLLLCYGCILAVFDYWNALWYRAQYKLFIIIIIIVVVVVIDHFIFYFIHILQKFRSQDFKLVQLL